MAFKSQKQADYYQWMLDRKKITQEEFDKKAKGTPKELPEKTPPKAPRQVKVI